MNRLAGSSPVGNAQPPQPSLRRKARGLQERLEEFLALGRRQDSKHFSVLSNGSSRDADSVVGLERLDDALITHGLVFVFVVDDLLDYTAEASTLGKRTGKDAGRGKLTYPGLLGLGGARQKAQELIASARCEAEKFGDSGRRLRLLADFVLERSY